MPRRTCERCGTAWGADLALCPDDGGVLRAAVEVPRVNPDTWTLYERPTGGAADQDDPFEVPTDELPALQFTQRARVADTHPAPRPRPSPSASERDDSDGRVYVQMKVRRNAAFSDTDWSPPNDTRTR